MSRKISALRRSLAALAGLGMALWAPVASAQAPVPPPGPGAPAQFDPSDVFFQGWMLTRDAEKLAGEGEHLEALNKLRRARELFTAIDQQFPTWKKSMVERRIRKTNENIAKVYPEAAAEKEKRDRAFAELEGGHKVEAVQGEDPARVELDLPEGMMPSTGSAETLASRRIKELQSEVGRLQREIDAAGDPDAAAREARRANEVERQRDLARAQLRRLQDELQRLRRQKSPDPMNAEMRALADRIRGLERERSAMTEALKSSQAETRRAEAQIEALQQERARLLQQEADLKRNLELERKTSNEVVAGQQRQLRHFQEQLRQKDIELGEAKQKITSLQHELAEVRESFAEVREERDGLLRERDQMAALLKLNEAGQIQQLVDQNMALAKELRESNDRYEALREDSDATKDDLLEALRDLAITKMRIQEFRREKQRQDERIEQLEQRLRNEEHALATGEGDPVEVATLRGIIQRQLRIQDKRREARELLVEALRDKAGEDDEIQQAMAIFQGAELNLTPEEMQVVDGEEVDGVIISPYARPRAEVEASLAALGRDLEPYKKAGDRAYHSNRYLAARETYRMVLDRHPGETTTMCKLGLVELQLDDPMAAGLMFRQASELDPRNPYAHRMLGVALMQTGDDLDALSALERSVALAPTQAESHVLVGMLHFRLKNPGEAEESLKTAVACDETSPVPHYNLAILYEAGGEKKKALEHYRKALELGAAPNLELERRIGSSEG